MALLDVQNLTLFAGRARLLEGVSFAIGEGEWVALAGPSGSGKSRLLAALMGFGDGVRGGIHLAGRAPSAPHHPPATAYFEPLAAVFQEHALLDELTVRENLELAGATPEQVAQLLRRASLDPDADADKLPAALSGGMARRVALARALVRPPQLLILDEPLAGVDPATRDLLVRWLREIRETHPRLAAIVVAHEIDVLAGLCDRALILRPRERRIEELPLAGLAPAEARAALERALPQQAAEPAQTKPPRPATTALEEFRNQMRETALAAWEGLFLAPRLLLGIATGFAHGRFLEFFIRYGFLSLPFILTVNLIVGLSLVIQTEDILSPIRQTQRLPQAMVTAVVEGFGPLLVGLLMAGRAGASQCGEIGMKRLARQWEALWLTGHDADRELFAPRAAGLVLAVPLLVLAGQAAALFSGALYYRLAASPALTGRFYVADLFQHLTTGGVAIALLKGLLFGAGIALCAYSVGRRPRRSSEDIAAATTAATTLAATAVIVIDFAVNLVLV